MLICVPCRHMSLDGVSCGNFLLVSLYSSILNEWLKIEEREENEIGREKVCKTDKNGAGQSGWE